MSGKVQLQGVAGWPTPNGKCLNFSIFRSARTSSVSLVDPIARSPVRAKNLDHLHTGLMNHQKTSDLPLDSRGP